MKFRKTITTMSMGALSLATFSACTPTEQGAGYGALAGGGIGALAGRDTTSTLAGAAIGAAAGALVGTAIEADQRNRYRRNAPPGGYPTATRVRGQRGYVYSPYSNRVVDVRGVPRGGLVKDPYTGRVFIRP